jgi:hypothetical protein
MKSPSKEAALTMKIGAATVFLEGIGAGALYKSINDIDIAGIVTGSFAIILGYIPAYLTGYRISEYHRDFIGDLKQNVELFLYRMPHPVF